jgi:hypothetical protein
LKRIVLAGAVAQGGSGYFTPPSKADERENQKDVLFMRLKEDERAEMEDELVFMRLRAKRDQILLKHELGMPITQDDDDFMQGLSFGKKAGQIYVEILPREPFKAFQRA